MKHLRGHTGQHSPSSLVDGRPPQDVMQSVACAFTDDCESHHIIIIEKVICHELTMQTSSPRVEFPLVPAHVLERE